MQFAKDHPFSNKPIINTDLIGAFASSLCMIHCIATPFLFIAQTCSAACCDAAPTLWRWLDYVFLAVSFIAVWQTSKTSSKNWVKYALWLSWALLLSTISIEKLALLHLPEGTIYLPALALVGLHFYNLKYCQCAEDKCSL